MGAAAITTITIPSISHHRQHSCDPCAPQTTMKKEPFQIDGGAREEEEEDDSADARAKRALDDFLQAGNRIEV
jgi:hypothetical protein